MIQIVVILLCSLIFVPLVNLICTPESPKLAVILNGVAYLITLIYVLYLTFFIKG